MLSIIVAMDRNRVIGYQNKIPWNLPEDLARLKQITIGKPIVMGRKTFESIGHPLSGRQNIVISKNRYFQHKGIEVIDSMESIFETYQRGEVECFIFGGASIYQEAYPHVSKLYLTCIDAAFTGDRYFPEIDMDDWVVLDEVPGTPDPSCPCRYKFVNLQRRKGNC